MTYEHAPRSTRAATAIAAVLALASTPALAQVASPSPADPVPVASPAPTASGGSTAMPLDITADTPQPAPVTSPSSTAPSSRIDVGDPVVILPESAVPDATAPIAPSSPVVEATAPRPAASQATATQPAPSRSTTVTPPVAATPASVPTAEAPGTAADGALADGDVPAEAIPFAAAAPGDESETTPAAADPQGDTLPIAGIAGLLAALGIAGVGAAAMRRRKPAVTEPPRSDRVDRAPLEPARPSDVARVSPAAASAPPPVQQRIARPRPTSAEVVPPAFPVTAGATGLAAGAPGRSETSLGVLKALGDQPVPHGEARESLLRRMVAAEPDSANPFRSRKARRRRARVQLKHHEALQSRGEAFDWRTYKPTTRPSLARSPDLVTA